MGPPKKLAKTLPTTATEGGVTKPLASKEESERATAGQVPPKILGPFRPHAHGSSTRRVNPRVAKLKLKLNLPAGWRLLSAVISPDQFLTSPQ